MAASLETGRSLNYLIIDPVGIVLQEGKLGSTLHLNGKTGIYFLIIRAGIQTIQMEKLIVE